MNYTLRIPNQEDHTEPPQAGEYIVGSERLPQQNPQPPSHAPNSGRSLRDMIEEISRVGEQTMGEDERKALEREIREGIVAITRGADLLVRKRQAVLKHPHILDRNAIELDLKEAA